MNSAPQCASFSTSSVKRRSPDLHLPRPKHDPSAYILEKNGDQEHYVYPVNRLLTIDPPATAEREHLVKRSTGTALPEVPGTLTCPGSNGLDETDNNVYSDCMSVSHIRQQSYLTVSIVPTDLDALAKRELEGIPEDEDDYDFLDFLLAGDDEDGTIFRRTGTPYFHVNMWSKMMIHTLKTLIRSPLYDFCCDCNIPFTTNFFMYRQARSKFLVAMA